MNEFLLLVLIIIYVVISYVPISGAPKPTWQTQSNDGLLDTNTETEATGARHSHLDS